VELSKVTTHLKGALACEYFLGGCDKDMSTTIKAWRSRWGAWDG
jgi:hypothetical protein